LDWLTCSRSFPCTQTVHEGGDNAEVGAAVVVGDTVGIGVGAAVKLDGNGELLKRLFETKAPVGDIKFVGEDVGRGFDVIVGVDVVG
jgi:hypothetical protein